MRLTSQVGIERDLSNLPWTSWTPTVTAGAGTITSTTIYHATYRKIGKLVQYSVALKITNAGTGSSTLLISTPSGLAPSGGNQVGVGREIAVSGAMLFVLALSGNLYTWKYDYAALITTNNEVALSGWYRIA